MGARTKVNLADFSIAVLGSSTPLLASTFGRNYLQIKNNGPSACAVNLLGGTAALNTRASVQLASGAQLLFQKNVPQGSINAISAGTSQLAVYCDDTPTPFWLLNGNQTPTVDLDFQRGRYFNQVLFTSPPISVTRTMTSGTATNLLPSSASGTTITTFADNVPRITSGLGLLMEDARTNQLINSTVPATQTPSLANGTYTLWVNGSGTATSSAGTAVGAGFGIASQGSPNVFTVTNPGTVVVTVAGSLNAFQCELSQFGTSLIVTGAAIGTRSGETGTVSGAPAFGAQFSYFSQGTSFINTSAPQNPVTMSLSDGTTANATFHSLTRTTGRFTNFLNVGGVLQYNNTVGTANVIGTSAKFASALAPSDQIDVTGSNTNANAATPIFVPTQIDLRRVGVAVTWNGYIEHIAVWPTIRLPNATLTTLTT